MKHASTAVGALLVLFCLADLVHAWNIETVADTDALEAIVDVAWTNNSLAKIIPPGDFDYNNTLGVIAYEDGFDTNFLVALLVVTNGTGTNTFLRYPVEVIETTNGSDRVRYYMSAISTNPTAVHTTTVSIANYPEDWIEEVYGEAPGWLSGAALQQWYDDRDPWRQHVYCDLIATSSIPDYVAWLTNSIPVYSDGTNTNTLLTIYSNDIAFVEIESGSDGIDLYLHAPTNVPTLDLFKSTNLLETYGWTLPVTLDHTLDPILWTYTGADSPAFFAAGNAAVDTDGDGLADIREIRMHGTSIYLADSDGDGLSDGLEIMTYGLDPLSTDTDGDGIPDDEEVELGTSPGSADSDGDGITDFGELYTYFGHVDPMDADTDDDGLNDYAEIITFGTYAAPDCNGARDTDGDNLSDYVEVNTYSTDPLSTDTDGDGMYDYFETYYGLDPNDAGDATDDEDGDGFNNLTECQWCLSPVSSNSHASSSQRLIVRAPGTNGIRTIADSTHYRVLAVGDLGSRSALVRVRPFYQNGALADQRLYHTQTPGMYINGTEASSVASPIEISASSTAVEFKITADEPAAGTNLWLDLKDTNDYESIYCDAGFYVPQMYKVEFTGPGDEDVEVAYGETNVLWFAMPADSNACRVYMHPYQSGTYDYGIDYFFWSDWVRVKVTGSGADPATATLNDLDWRSAHGYNYSDAHTRGIKLAPGSYTFDVGYDLSGNAAVDSDEVQETCIVNVPKTDIDVDGENDGDIDANDEAIENALPGKIIWADKDAYWRDGVTNSQIVAVDLDFDMGGSTVPSNAYVVLQWFDSTTANYSNLRLFEDAAGTTPIERGGWDEEFGWTPNLGCLYKPGETVPDTVYVSAATWALRPVGGDECQTIVADTISLTCYRLDEEEEVSRDDVKVSICNSPAVSPKGKDCFLWEEDYTDLGNLHSDVTNFWDAIESDLVGDGIHVKPYSEKYFNSTEDNLDASEFAALDDAAILMTVAHGSPGYVCPVAFPRTPTGYTNASDWATALGSTWASPEQNITYDCWFVKVKTTFFQSNWKTTRDANDAIFFAVTCYAATSNAVPALPAYIDAVGGEAAVGYTNSCAGDLMITKYACMIDEMRTAKWRTALGAAEIKDIETAGYRLAGDGKVTLWPAPLKGSAWASYPKEHHQEGTALVVFDTVLAHETSPLKKDSGDADMTGSTPSWIDFGGEHAAVRWPYTKDTSSSVETEMRARADKCYTEWTGVEFTGKKLAADGKSCGRDLEWEF